MKNHQNLIYLDSAATAYPKLPAVLDAMTSFYRNYGMNPGRSGGDMQQVAADKIDATRKLLATLFSAPDYKRVVLTPSATFALNTAILGSLRPGDHVVTTVTEHNSVIRPLHLFSKNNEIDITWLEPEADGLIHPESVSEALRDNTRLVIVNHASNVTGVVQPISAIGAAVADHPCLYLVDTAQTAGMVKVDMVGNHIDMLSVAGHKSLHGPAGIGALLLSNRADPEPIVAGGTGINSIDPHQPPELPARLECGTMNLPGVAGLHAALCWLEREDMGENLNRIRRLHRSLAEGLQTIPGVTLHGYSPTRELMPTLSFNLEKKDPAMVTTFLDVDYNIISRSGLHCAPGLHKWLGTAPAGSVRMSLGLETDQADVDAAIGAVEEIAALELGG